MSSRIELSSSQVVQCPVTNRKPLCSVNCPIGLREFGKSQVPRWQLVSFFCLHVVVFCLFVTSCVKQLWYWPMVEKEPSS